MPQKRRKLLPGQIVVEVPSAERQKVEELLRKATAEARPKIEVLKEMKQSYEKYAKIVVTLHSVGNGRLRFDPNRQNEDGFTVFYAHGFLAIVTLLGTFLQPVSWWWVMQLCFTYRQTPSRACLSWLLAQGCELKVKGKQTFPPQYLTYTNEIEPLLRDICRLANVNELLIAKERKRSPNVEIIFDEY
jgi:hypothetical protein